MILLGLALHLSQLLWSMLPTVASLLPHLFSPVSSGLILVFPVQVGKMVFPDWYQVGGPLRKIPPEQLLSALFWALVGTATCSLELDINWSQPHDVACLLISAPRSLLITYKSKQKLLLFFLSDNHMCRFVW